jgi:hypothetical protein
MRSPLRLAFLSLAFLCACHGPDPSPATAKPAEEGRPETSGTLDSLVLSSVTVSYPVPDGRGGATLHNYSGIALDAVHVLTVIPHDLPAAAAAPTVWFEDPSKNGTSWNFDTLPAQEVVLPDLGLKVIVSEKPLPGSAPLAPKASPKLGDDVWVIGNYAEGVDAALMRGNVAKIGTPPNDEGTYLVESSLTGSSAGGGVFDRHGALIGIVVAPFTAKELGIFGARLGSVVGAEKIAEALRERKIDFRTAE